MRGKFTGSGSDFEDHSQNWPDHSRATPMESEIDLFALTGLFVKRKKWIVASVGSVVIVVTVILLILPNKYTSTASILPSGEVSKLAELGDVSSFGEFALKDGSSSMLFPVVLSSRLIHEAVLNREYSFTHNSKLMTLTLAKYFNQDNPDKLRRALANITSVKTDNKTGVISVAVETKYAEFSREILNQYLGELETFNLHKRRSQAKDRARYLGRQLKDMKHELEKAEDTLEQFQKVNRDWSTSSDPEVWKILLRLQRGVELKSKTYFFLCEQYEVAKLDAQKDVPIVRVLDWPSLPTVKSGPRRMLVVLISGVMSLFGAFFFVVIFEGLKKRSLGADRESYLALRKDVQSTFPRVTRLVGHGGR